MSDSETLAARLHDLWIAAEVTLPHIAAAYSEATGHAHNSSWNEDAGFERTERHPTGETGPFGIPLSESVESMGPVYPEWSALRDTLHEILLETFTNLMDTSRALAWVTNEYAQTDEDAEAYLKEANAQYLEDHRFPDQRPPHVPAPSYPGDPHDTVTVSSEVDVEVPVPVPGEFDPENPLASEGPTVERQQVQVETEVVTG